MSIEKSKIALTVDPELELLAKKVVAKRSKKKARVESIAKDLAILLVRDSLSYRELTEIASEMLGEPVSQNYLYQIVRAQVAEIKPSIEGGDANAKQ